MRWSFLVLLAGCGGKSGLADPPTATNGVPDGPQIVDHLGETHVIRSGFADSYDDDGQTRRFLVLSDMVDACSSLSWWADRDASLSDMFTDDPFDEALFLEALGNTQDVFADEMSTDRPWFLTIDLDDVPVGSEAVVPGATRASYWGDPVFWGTATLLLEPTYESDTTASGSSRSWGPDGYEAEATGGTLTVTFDATGARGSVDTVIETEALAQFDVQIDFDVPTCTDWLDILLER